MYQFKSLFASKCVLCCVLLFNFASHAQWLIDDYGCRTPDLGVGNCLKIKECSPMTDFLKSVSSPIPPEIITELNKYVCGYDGTFKVCCPSTPISIKTHEDILLENPPPPPDVTNHKNFHLLPEECGYLGSPDRIRDGENAKLNEFPWMALLSYNKNGPKFQCGGTILNDRYILTAAHCLSNLTYPLIGVRVGEHNISSKIDCEILSTGKEVCSPLPVQDLSIEEVIIHPGFSRHLIVDDIGLLRVSKMNTSVANVRPVCLPITEDVRNAKINYCVVTGWGVTDIVSGRNADVLQKVDLPIMTLPQCKQVYKNMNMVKLSYKQICAGGKDSRDSCRGDSGGPMQVAAYLNDDNRYVQQGIVSFGHHICGTAGYPGVYTRIAYYMDWILDNMKP